MRERFLALTLDFPEMRFPILDFEKYETRVRAFSVTSSWRQGHTRAPRLKENLPGSLEILLLDVQKPYGGKVEFIELRTSFNTSK